MMNPPFALKRSDEKEFRFVNHTLRQVQHGGLLFSVLPTATMVKPGVYRQWRRESLLAENTLLAVVTFPLDLFYPVAVGTVGVFIQKGIPHIPSRNVLWIRAINDGLLKRKGKRVPSERATNDLNEVREILRAFLGNPSYNVPNIEKLQKACPIDYADTGFELVPECYLDQPRPTHEEIQQGMEQVIRDAVAFQIRFGKEQ